MPRTCASLSLCLSDPLQRGITPLNVACQRGHPEVISVLFKSGADVFGEDDVRQ
jgi:ankyrin repeat protein